MLSITNDHNEEDAYKKCVRPIERSLACVNLLEYKKEYESITANGGGGGESFEYYRAFGRGFCEFSCDTTTILWPLLPGPPTPLSP